MMEFCGKHQEEILETLNSLILTNSNLQLAVAHDVVYTTNSKEDALKALATLYNEGDLEVFAQQIIDHLIDTLSE